MLGFGVASVKDLLRRGSLAVECGVACIRQFLSRTRCKRTSFAGVRRAVWWDVEGGAKGDDGDGEAVGPGVEGRVDSEGEGARVSRLRVSYGEEYGAVAMGFFCLVGRGVLWIGEGESVSSLG